LLSDKMVEKEVVQRGEVPEGEIWRNPSLVENSKTNLMDDRGFAIPNGIIDANVRYQEQGGGISEITGFQVLVVHNSDAGDEMLELYQRAFTVMGLDFEETDAGVRGQEGDATLFRVKPEALKGADALGKITELFPLKMVSGLGQMFESSSMQNLEDRVAKKEKMLAGVDGVLTRVAPKP